MKKTTLRMFHFFTTAVVAVAFSLIIFTRCHVGNAQVEFKKGVPGSFNEAELWFDSIHSKNPCDM